LQPLVADDALVLYLFYQISQSCYLVEQRNNNILHNVSIYKVHVVSRAEKSELRAVQ